MDSLLEAAVLSRVVRGQAARDPDRVVLVFENGQLRDRVTGALSPPALRSWVDSRLASPKAS